MGKRYWFPAKRYGWGWGLPSAWQGWVVLGSFLVVVAFARFAMSRPVALVVTIIATVAVLVVAQATGEPTRWRWGDKSR